MPAIILVRHAQASYGTHDYDRLNEVGHGQAVVVHRALAARGIAAGRVVCGAMRRQQETARPWVDEGVEVVTDPRLDEYSSDWVLEAHGDSSVAVEQGEDGRQVLSQREFQEIIDVALIAWIEAGADGGARETHPAFKARVLDAIGDATTGLASGSPVVVVTSAGVIGLLCAAAARLPDTAMVAFNRISINASITKIISGRSGLTLIAFNEHGHLEADGLITYR